MTLRSVALRHGRRVLAAPLQPPAIRRLATEVRPESANVESASTAGSPAPVSEQGWSSPQPAGAPPRIRLSSKKKKQKSAQETVTALGSEAVREHQGDSWARPHEVGSGLMSPAQQYAEFQRIKKNTRKLGTDVIKRHKPSDLIANAPRPEDVTLELLMASQTHMGHNTSKWNPANSRYIFGVRENIHIISLETTAAHLRRAARVVEEVAYHGGLILFAGTRKGHMEIVTNAAKLAMACHLFTKWTPGSITNRDVILKNRMQKVVDHLDKELQDFDDYNGTTRPLIPDLVICLNPLENYTLLYECGLKNIPTIGVIDTDANPSWVTYTIPSNDDSLRAMALVAGVLGRAGEKGSKRRLEDASLGKVPWKTSPDLQNHMSKEVKAAMTKQKEVMGQMQSQVEGFTDEEKKMLSRHYDEAASDFDEAKMMDVLSETALGKEERAEAVAGEAAAAAGPGQDARETAATMEAAEVETEAAEVKTDDKGVPNSDKAKDS